MRKTGKKEGILKEDRYEGTGKIEEDRGGVRLDGARKDEDEKERGRLNKKEEEE